MNYGCWCWKIVTIVGVLGSVAYIENSPAPFDAQFHEDSAQYRCVNGTRKISELLRTRAMADGPVLSGNHLVLQGLVNGVMVNDVGDSVGQGVVNVAMPNGISGSTVEGMGSGMMANGFSKSVTTNSVSESVPQGIGIGVRDNVVSESVPQGMVNGVRANGVSESVYLGIGDGIMANGVREPVRRGMVNGVRNNGVSRANRESVSEVVVDGSSSSFRQTASESVDQLDKERVLRCFNQEVVEDLGRLREYRSIARGLKVVMRRRREHIRQLQLLRNCEDVAATIRFWERMQLEDVEKGTRALLMMKETEVKIGEKANYILNLRRGGVEVIANIAYSMEALPRCDELRRSSCSEEWEDMIILYYRRAIVEDSNLAREIDGFCAGLTARIEKREYFIDELDVLADRFVPEKMAEFMKETQEKERNRLMRLQILGREFELRADEKKHFIEKLKGNVNF
ncbi:hypothetical protein Tco_0500913 [Tanacetum coccineum]